MKNILQVGLMESPAHLGFVDENERISISHCVADNKQIYMATRTHGKTQTHAHPKICTCIYIYVCVSVCVGVDILNGCLKRNGTWGYLLFTYEISTLPSISIRNENSL